MDLCFIVTSCKSSRIYRNKGHQAGKPYDKDDSDYLAFEETTCSYSKFFYHSTFSVQACTTGFLAHSNLLYDNIKYSNRTMICIPLQGIDYGRQVKA